MNTHLLAISAAALAAAATHADAVHAGDIGIELDYLGRIQTYLIDEDTGLPTYNTRVFIADFDQTGFTNEPGVDSDLDAFSYPSSIGFNIRKAIRQWNGVDFSQVPADRIQIKLANLGPVLTPATDVLTPGFAMSVNTDGEFHHHPGYSWLGETPTGVYLIELELWSTDPSVTTSRPYWIIFNSNDSVENVNAATEWAEQNLIGCPSDFDGSGFVDVDDFNMFVPAFEAGDHTADFDQSGFVDVDDFNTFVVSFEAGC